LAIGNWQSATLFEDPDCARPAYAVGTGSEILSAVAQHAAISRSAYVTVRSICLQQVEVEAAFYSNGRKTFLLLKKLTST
jgi:hypothetical protein